MKPGQETSTVFYHLLAAAVGELVFFLWVHLHFWSRMSFLSTLHVYFCVLLTKSLRGKYQEIMSPDRYKKLALQPRLNLKDYLEFLSARDGHT